MRMILELEIPHGRFRLLPCIKSGSWFQSHYADLTNRKDGELVFAVEP